MRRNEFEVTDKTKIEKVLNECPFCTISFVDFNNEPYAATVNFVYYREHIYFHSANYGKKADIIKIRPLVYFTTFKAYSSIPSYFKSKNMACFAGQLFASVHIKGTVKTIQDNDFKSEILIAFMNKFQPEGGFELIYPDNDLYQEMFKKVSVLEIDMIDISAKFRFNQHEPYEAKLSLLKNLEKRGKAIDIETVKFIRENNLY
ncbi:Pyridoxamine 5'-phosphate oxidase-related, FMN-binding [Desulfurella amilsii]|uniref:Pyridoxamine 5'-phosphate oxidase-related, FMN-binding n=1 Tax=Desulfurella amilsii TaxID=1562698 RepID=A0A1X4XUE6_9BACT|nr:pyridoxamine 5'-phosphate oxidase family protein [Desulfurella amilsii]OSS41156.1 Pyridoxamine 5'-phosphate oxidase-related, FMN-binding [Desulfurella amilsii]